MNQIQENRDKLYLIASIIDNYRSFGASFSIIGTLLTELQKKELKTYAEYYYGDFDFKYDRELHLLIPEFYTGVLLSTYHRPQWN